MGVPCPNLFTGMQLVHGPLEYVSTADMAAAVRLGLRLVELWGSERG
jgi:tripeptide aminopeptidase